MNVQCIIGDQEFGSILKENFGEIPTPIIRVGINAKKTVLSVNGCPPEIIPWPSRSLVCSATPGIRIRKEPASKSKTSGALYLFELEFYYRGLKRAILGQFLPAGAKTSYHLHTKTTEIFIPIAGKTLYSFNGQQPQSLKSRILIEPGSPHYLIAETDAFNVIFMDGPYGLAMTDHHYMFRTAI